MGDVVRFQDARRRREDAPPVDPEANSGPRLAPPPHDLDAEAAVLSACMLDGTTRHDGSPSALEVVLEILPDPSKFYSLANGRIFEAILTLRIAGTPIDTITIATWLRDQGLLEKAGGTSYLAQICDGTPCVGNVGAHAETVLRKWEDRQLLEALHRHAAEARRPEEAEGGRDAFRARARASLGAATAPRVQLVGAPMGAIVQQVRAELDAAAREKVPTGIAWSTAFQALDDFGLLQQGTQEIITGRPGMGKTGFTFQLTRRAVEAEPIQGVGEAVYWWCGEMDPAKLVMREAANQCGLRFHDVLRGRVSAARLEVFAHVLDRLGRLPIWWDHEPATPEELAGRVRRVKALFETGKARREPGPGEVAGRLFPKCRLRLVAIDQLSEFKPPVGLSPRADSREKFGAIARTTRALIAVKLNVTTLLLAQLARPKDPRKVELPTLAELRESGAIEENADGVTAIHRREYYERQRTSEEWKHVAEVLKLKGRYGEADDVRLGFYGGKFSDRLPAAARGEPHYEGQNDEPGDDDQ